MNSLSEFLSSPLLDFIPGNLPSNNTEWPDELNMLLETLSERDIHLLDRKATDNASDISCHAYAPEIPMTTPLH